jgi:hypothetical protein
MGLRRLLTRQPAAEPPTEPLARLAEIGRAEDPPAQEGDRASSAASPTGRLAPPTTQGDPVPISPVTVDKKVELVSESAGQVAAAKSKRAVEPPRSRSGYVWRSQASRSKRAAWADMPEKF